MKYIFGIIFILLLISNTGYSKENNIITISTTIEPVDAGIIGVFETEFKKETGITVNHIAAEAFKKSQGARCSSLLEETSQARITRNL